jgi:hypothetical protein
LKRNGSPDLAQHRHQVGRIHIPLLTLECCDLLTMTKSTVIEVTMEPEGVGTIDLSSTAVLIIDMQVRKNHSYSMYHFSSQIWPSFPQLHV